MIVATVEVRWISTWLSEVALPSGTALTLVAADGEILQRWVDGERIAQQDLQGEAAWRDLLKAEVNVVESADLDGALRLNTIVPLGADGQLAAYLHLGYPVAELYTKAYQALWWKLALLGGTLFIALLLAWWGSEQWFLQPLSQLMSAIGQVRAGDLTVRPRPGAA